MKRIMKLLDTRRDEMLSRIERLVNVDSGTFYKEGVDEIGRMVAEELSGLGFRVATIEETQGGGHVRADRDGTGEKRLFLSAHLDTVYPRGTAAERPFRVVGGLAYGPGVGDMKGGIVQMICALEALRDLGLDTPPISIFLTGDEEEGSVRGRPHIEEMARHCSWAMVMEPSSAPGSIAVRRWGIGSFYLTIHGRAAHVLKPESGGVNATAELAHKILALEALSDPRHGVRVSVNLVSGGRSRQVTAAEARAAVDVRIREGALTAEVEERVRRVAAAPVLPGIRIEVEGGITRPPLEPNPATQALLKIAASVAKEAGIDLTPMEEYGGSDGCFTSALGVATLDGMGPLTHDMCGDEERIEIASLVPRTAWMAGIIARLGDIQK